LEALAPSGVCGGGVGGAALLLDAQRKTKFCRGMALRHFINRFNGRPLALLHPSGKASTLEQALVGPLIFCAVPLANEVVCRAINQYLSRTIP